MLSSEDSLIRTESILEKTVSCPAFAAPLCYRALWKVKRCFFRRLAHAHIDNEERMQSGEDNLMRRESFLEKTV